MAGGHVEVDFAALPGVADFARASRDQAQQGSDIWKDVDDAGSAFELLVNPLDHIAGAHFHPMLWGEVKNREALRHIALEPRGELRCAFGITFNHVLTECLRRLFTRGMKDGAQLLQDFWSEGLFRNVVHGILEPQEGTSQEGTEPQEVRKWICSGCSL